MTKTRHILALVCALLMLSCSAAFAAPQQQEAPRPTLSVEQIGKVIAFVKSVKPDIICMVDNCYGEFVETVEPSDVGADMTVGSLIKNPGGGMAETVCSAH